MLTYHTGDLFDSGAEALVNPVNCVGVMGKGLALEFRKRFPKNYSLYIDACLNSRFHVGEMLIVAFPKSSQRRFPIIVNFPTKQHWQDPSQLSCIQSGLSSLVEKVRDLDIHSIAIPALSCGEGRLQWLEVKPLIEEAFVRLPEVKVMVFEPR